MKNFFFILGIIYAILICISIILQIVNVIKAKLDMKKFKNSIDETEELNKTFEKLTPDKINELREKHTVAEKTIDIKAQNEENYKVIMEKYKDYQIKDMDSFIDELTRYLRTNANDNSCIISDWFKIIKKDGTCIDKFTFEVQSKNIFIIFGRDGVVEGKFITNICGFNDVKDFDILLKDYYQCDHIERE